MPIKLGPIKFPTTIYLIGNSMFSKITIVLIIPNSFKFEPFAVISFTQSIGSGMIPIGKLSALIIDAVAPVSITKLYSMLLILPTTLSLCPGSNTAGSEVGLHVVIYFFIVSPLLCCCSYQFFMFEFVLCLGIVKS